MLSPWLIMPGFSAASTLAANLDIPRLFDQAHWIVKAVMVLLAVMFVVMSVVRWRYFQSKARRWGRKPDEPRDAP